MTGYYLLGYWTGDMDHKERNLIYDSSELELVRELVGGRDMVTVIGILERRNPLQHALIFPTL